MKRLFITLALLGSFSSPAWADGSMCLLGVGMGGQCPTGGATATTNPPTTGTVAPVPGTPGRQVWMTVAEARQAYATGRVITGEVRDDAGNITFVTYRPVTSVHSAGRAGRGDDLDQTGVELGPETGWVPYTPVNAPSVGQLQVALWNEVAAIDQELVALGSQAASVAQAYWNDPQNAGHWLAQWNQTRARIDYLVGIRGVMAATYERLRTGAR